MKFSIQKGVILYCKCKITPCFWNINLALIYRHFLYLCIMEKIDFRTVSEFERLALRKRAIRLIVSGTRKGVVADLIGVRPNTVSG